MGMVRIVSQIETCRTVPRADWKNLSFSRHAPTKLEGGNPASRGSGRIIGGLYNNLFTVPVCIVVAMEADVAVIFCTRILFAFFVVFRNIYSRTKT